jgi:hypothetical protein
MEYKISCPNCMKTISNNSIVNEAPKGVGSETQSIVCACGEEISYWQITALLRDQNTRKISINGFEAMPGVNSRISYR